VGSREINQSSAVSGCGSPPELVSIPIFNIFHGVQSAYMRGKQFSLGRTISIQGRGWLCFLRYLKQVLHVQFESTLLWNTNSDDDHAIRVFWRCYPSSTAAEKNRHPEVLTLCCTCIESVGYLP